MNFHPPTQTFPNNQGGGVSGGESGGGAYTAALAHFGGTGLQVTTGTTSATGAPPPTAIAATNTATTLTPTAASLVTGLQGMQGHLQSMAQFAQDQNAQLQRQRQRQRQRQFQFRYADSNPDSNPDPDPCPDPDPTSSATLDRCQTSFGRLILDVHQLQQYVSRLSQEACIVAQHHRNQLAAAQAATQEAVAVAQAAVQAAAHGATSQVVVPPALAVHVLPQQQEATATATATANVTATTATITGTVATPVNNHNHNHDSNSNSISSRKRPRIHHPQPLSPPRTTVTMTAPAASTTTLTTPTTTTTTTTTAPVATIAVVGRRHGARRQPYKRRADRPLPVVAPPANGTQYTKPEAMMILAAQPTPKDRNQLIYHWLATRQVPVTSDITMNKYCREYNRQQQQGEGGSGHDHPHHHHKVDWEGTNRTAPLPIVPDPADGRQMYTRREAVTILLPLTSTQRLPLVSKWMAAHQIPIKSMSAVERTIQKAVVEGMDAIGEHWGRWGDTQQEQKRKRQQKEEKEVVEARSGGNSSGNSTSKKKAATAETKKKTKKRQQLLLLQEQQRSGHHQEPLLPPYPQPKSGTMYTKLEAVAILQKLPTSERNQILWKWIHYQQVPLRHPNSMVRVLREAKNGTMKRLDWKTPETAMVVANAASSAAGTFTNPPTSTASCSEPKKVALPHLPWMPPPRDGSMYKLPEMIALTKYLEARDRVALIRQWVQDHRVPYTSPLSANAAVVRTLKQEQLAHAKAHGMPPPRRINAAATAAAPPKHATSPPPTPPVVVVVPPPSIVPNDTSNCNIDDYRDDMDVIQGAAMSVTAPAGGVVN